MAIPSDAQKQHKESEIGDRGYVEDPKAACPADSTRYSSVQLFFIIRLSKLIGQRHDCARALDTDDWRMKLLNKSIYSTYRDCMDLGIGEDARTLFRREKDAQANS